VDDVGREADVEHGRVRRKRAGMLVLIAMGGDEVRAIGRAIDGDFAAGAAADSADRLSFRRTEARSFSLFANRAGHTASETANANEQDTPR
jgi:hypothetical protein